MPSCPQLSSCGLHRNVSVNAALRVWESCYCDGAFARCERFKLAVAGVPVPEKLLPNGRLLDAAEPALAAASQRR
jgi:hypothetical protein